MPVFILFQFYLYNHTYNLREIFGTWLVKLSFSFLAFPACTVLLVTRMSLPPEFIFLGQTLVLPCSELVALSFFCLLIKSHIMCCFKVGSWCWRCSWLGKKCFPVLLKLWIQFPASQTFLKLGVVCTAVIPALGKLRQEVQGHYT